VNPLLPFIGKAKFAQDILAKIETDGYIVLPGIFTPAEADVEYDRMWRWVERVSPGVRRNSPASWQQHGGVDPWPCSQRDMMQGHQAGWVFSELREAMALRVFEPLYGTDELHCSKDGFTLQRPTHRELSRRPNDHFDQGAHHQGLHCIQGSVALTDQEHEDGCFSCWPGSHEYHQEIFSNRRRAASGQRKDFAILDEKQKEYLQEQGIQNLRVPVRRGDVILWRSDLVHCGATPIGKRDTFRGVAYICMLPALLTPEELYPKKRAAYEELETSSHWPCKEEWFEQRREPRTALRAFFKHPPALTTRQEELYGLVHYKARNPTSDKGAQAPKGGGKARRWGRKTAGGS